MYIEIVDGPILPLEHPRLRSVSEAAHDNYVTDWLRAPQEFRRDTYQDMAAYFWLKGRQQGLNEAAEATNEDLKEITRIAQLKTKHAR